MRRPRLASYGISGREGGFRIATPPPAVPQSTTQGWAALRVKDADACLFAGGADAGWWRRYRSFLVSGRMLPRQGLSSGPVRRNQKNQRRLAVARQGDQTT